MTQPYQSAQTPAEIINLAGLLCGLNSTTLNETGNRFIDMAEAMYGPLLEAELGANRWRFSETNQQLSNYETLLEADQFNGWLYSWELPADCLMIITVTPYVSYTRWADNKILTRSSQPLTLLYTKNLPVTMWPAPFKQYFTYALAYNMAMSGAGKSKATDILPMMQLWQSRALFADGQQQPSSQTIFNPWDDVRYAGGSVYNNPLGPW